MSAARDAGVVRRYVRHLRQRASEGADEVDCATADHEAEVLWTLARAISGDGLVAHVPLLRRASLDLLEQGGRRLCVDAARPSKSTSVRDRDEAIALKELGHALLDLRARFELQQ